MNYQLLDRAARLALSGLLVALTNGCTPAASPDGDTYDQQACSEDSVRRGLDPATAREALEQSSAFCRLGDLPACSMLGMLHELGLAVPRNPSRARALYRDACQRGNARACGNLGQLMLDAPATGESPSTAISLLARGCDGGQARACGALGRAYQAGTAVPPSQALATSWSERACDRGDAASCVRLVDLGVSSVRHEALLAKACARGDEEACARASSRTRTGGPTLVAGRSAP